MYLAHEQPLLYWSSVPLPDGQQCRLSQKLGAGTLAVGGAATPTPGVAGPVALCPAVTP